MKVWLVADCPPYEQDYLFGVYATEELAREVERRETGHMTFIAVWEEDVLTELPPEQPAKQPYQAIP